MGSTSQAYTHTLDAMAKVRDLQHARETHMCVTHTHTRARPTPQEHDDMAQRCPRLGLAPVILWPCDFCSTPTHGGAPLPLNYNNLPVSTLRPTQPLMLDKRHVELDNQPIISVITTVYKPDLEVFFETVASVMQQTLQRFEWILVNDASPDNYTAPLLDRVQKMDAEAGRSRVHVMHLKENRRLPGARNEGLKIARGKYLAMLDADDIWELTYLEKCVLFLELHPQFSLCNSWSYGFGYNSYWWVRVRRGGETLLSTLADVCNCGRRFWSGFEAGDVNLRENRISVCSVMTRTALVESNFFDATLKDGSEDWDLWLRMANHGRWCLRAR